MSEKFTYHIEMTPPKHSSQKLEEELERFQERFERIQESGFVASITDNAMGRLAFQTYEMIDELELIPRPDQVLIHLNTFHTKENLDHILEHAKEHGIRNILALTGDGSDKMHKLEPEELEAPDVKVTTSVELIKYIYKHYPDFIVGAAFNPYEPEDSEFAKLEKKIAAGAKYVITQPIVGQNAMVDRLRRDYPDFPVVVECWMSKKLHLLADIMEKDIPEDFPYDPMAELDNLQNLYPDCSNYLALIGYKTQYPVIEEKYNNQ
jgi:methylenetetrahydrofolate reductase (NADPH)